jgi:hypothetical protein
MFGPTSTKLQIFGYDTTDRLLLEISNSVLLCRTLLAVVAETIRLRPA